MISCSCQMWWFSANVETTNAASAKYDLWLWHNLRSKAPSSWLAREGATFPILFHVTKGRFSTFATMDYATKKFLLLVSHQPVHNPLVVAEGNLSRLRARLQRFLALWVLWVKLIVNMRRQWYHVTAPIHLHRTSVEVPIAQLSETFSGCNRLFQLSCND